MPVKSKPFTVTYHVTSLCSVSNQQDETESQLFFLCIKLKSVWNFFLFLLFKLTGYSLPSMYVFQFMFIF